MNERLKELAMQAGLPKYITRELCPTVIERFADLVRQDERAERGAILRKQDEQIKEMQLTNARLFEKFNKAILDEREACAMECIKLASSWARLGAWGTKTDFHECATAIRSRGEK